MRELIVWFDACEALARHTLGVVMIARNRLLPHLPECDQAQVRDLIEVLERAGAGLAKRLPTHGRSPEELKAWCDHQGRCKGLARWAACSLLLYINDASRVPGESREEIWESLQHFAEMLTGPGEHLAYTIRGRHIPVIKVLALRKALVENHLRQWRDWRDAEDPQAWVAWMMRRIAREEALQDAPLATRNRETGAYDPMVSLDDIAGTSAESSEHGVTVEPDYSSVFDRMEALAWDRGDEDLAAYVAGQRAAARRGDTDAKLIHRGIRLQMGWNKFHASAVRKRWERLKVQAGAEYITRGVISSASINVYREPLYEGERGREHGEWKHKEPRKQ